MKVSSGEFSKVFGNLSNVRQLFVCVLCNSDHQSSLAYIQTSDFLEVVSLGSVRLCSKKKGQLLNIVGNNVMQY